MGFEDKILQNIDKKKANQRKNQESDWRSHKELPPFVEKAYTRARQLFNNPLYAIQAPEFLRSTRDGVERGVYTREEITNDMLEVKRLEKNFEQESSPEEKNTKKYSDILEGIILERSRSGGWFGENVTTLKTSRYDDYKNGTDMLVQWEPNSGVEQVLGLAVDITFSTHASAKKFERIKREIRKDTLGSIRYFRNADGTFMGRRDHVPRVVIGVEKKMILELAELWDDNNNNNKKALSEHPIQYILIDEILQQTKQLLTYADKMGSQKAVREYQRILSIISSIAKDSAKDLEHLPQDHVHESITNALHNG